MGYSRGRRPQENASKSAHVFVANDPDVKAFLARCVPPKRAERHDLLEHLVVEPQPLADDPIEQVVAIDGGYTEVAVAEGYPGASLAFFQFGALFFSVQDLKDLSALAFIDPEGMAKLRNIERLKLALPVRNLPLQSEATLTHSIRRALYEFFERKRDESGRLAESLRWLVFEEFAGRSGSWSLASCPSCGDGPVELRREGMSTDHVFACPSCAEPIYLTDVLRLHERVDDEIGAGGILGNVTTAVEQLVLAHLIRLVLKTKPDLMKRILFVKDGPLAFFGQTANLSKPMRALLRHLLDRHGLFLVGLEKSGAFVDHAAALSGSDILRPGTALVLDDEYIHRHVVPGRTDEANPYGRNTYYGTKLIFRARDGRTHVATLPTREANSRPALADLANVDVILAYLERLKCDMYDNALVPIALANKLVSLANHPSAKILQRFAVGSIR